MGVILFVIALPQVERVEVTIAVDGASELIRSEIERNWLEFARNAEDQDACRHWEHRRASILWTWDVRFVDRLDIDFPGKPAIRIGRNMPWRVIPTDYWLFETAPILWIEWEQRRWSAGFRKPPGDGVWMKEHQEEFQDPERQLEPDPPWLVGSWKARQ